jgi:carboxylesterase
VWSILMLVGIVVLVIVAVLAAIAIWPTSTKDLGPDPQPAVDYADARARFDALAADEEFDVIDPCRSQLLGPGGPTQRVVVLLHGTYTCPAQMRQLGEQLAAEGANVLILRAPRHGLSRIGTDDLGGIGLVSALDAEDLRDWADDAVDIAAGLGERVEVLGHSMGGTAAAWAAQARDEVDRAVVVAPIISIEGWPGWATTAYMNFFGRMPDFSLAGEADVDHQYDGRSTRALSQVLRLARWVELEARDTPPAAGSIAVVLNPNDTVVDGGRVESNLVERWADEGAAVRVVDLPESPELPHDVIDPAVPRARPEVVDPILLELLRESAP